MCLPISPNAEGQAQHPVLPDGRDLTRIGQPLGEERRAKMRDRRAGPVEHLLRDPMVSRGMALCFTAGRNLRHVHDGFDSGLAGSLCERSAGRYASSLDWVDEIGRCDALQWDVD